MSGPIAQECKRGLINKATKSAITSVSLPLTVIILAYNEAESLPGCLGSLAGHISDVHLLDSGSTDGTVQIAREAGAKVHSNPFQGFGQQRNWAIDHIPHAHPWTLHLDADERLTPELVDELRGLLERSPSEAGFFVPNKLMLDDRWLRYSSGYPIYQVRLFHRERLRFVDHGHGQREVTDGTLGFLKQPYLHYAFSKGLDDWFAKHARYARAEAEELHRDRKGVIKSLRRMAKGNAVDRRRALKTMVYRVPMRPQLRMFYSLVLKRGFLDGRAGWTYAKMLAAYEAMIDVYVSRGRG